ncbi:hypothetical protein [Nesterenkonia pannonica]|uniref:hypothetical protein n=1 Tax=Nesterenkonia pannonica TaxID=1548602 RepID=UPI002164CD60|nr:hypothetical protein [Nesterenkonia pannonica]
MSGCSTSTWPSLVSLTDAAPPTSAATRSARAFTAARPFSDEVPCEMAASAAARCGPESSGAVLCRSAPEAETLTL